MWTQTKCEHRTRDQRMERTLGFRVMIRIDYSGGLWAFWADHLSIFSEFILADSGRKSSRCIGTIWRTTTTTMTETNGFLFAVFSAYNLILLAGEKNRNIFEKYDSPGRSGKIILTSSSARLLPFACRLKLISSFRKALLSLFLSKICEKNGNLTQEAKKSGQSLEQSHRRNWKKRQIKSMKAAILSNVLAYKIEVHFREKDYWNWKNRGNERNTTDVCMQCRYRKRKKHTRRQKQSNLQKVYIIMSRKKTEEDDKRRKGFSLFERRKIIPRPSVSRPLTIHASATSTCRDFDNT